MTDRPMTDRTTSTTYSDQPLTLSPFEERDADAKPRAVKEITPEIASEAIALLRDAKERLAVNALSDVGYFIGRAITILGVDEAVVESRPVVLDPTGD
jgi:hypothetical protein